MPATATPSQMTAAIAANKRLSAAARRFGNEALADRIDANTAKIVDALLYTAIFGDAEPDPAADAEPDYTD